MTDTRTSSPSKQRSPLLLALAGGFLLLLVATFLALGIWQVERLSWKLDLIARIEARIHAQPVAPPTSEEWKATTPAEAEYRRIKLQGTFDNSRETFVYASTELGAGYWVLTPFRLGDGRNILVNRGFVPTASRNPGTRAAGQPAGPLSVTGLLRLTEPGGTFIRSNDPASDRWYSRDVAAIAEKRGLSDTAPFFIDADATPNPGGLPVGGLTVVKFPNSHLVYAITWFALAAMAAAAAIFLVWTEIRVRHGKGVDRAGA